MNLLQCSEAKKAINRAPADSATQLVTNVDSLGEPTAVKGLTTNDSLLEAGKDEPVINAVDVHMRGKQEEKLFDFSPPDGYEAEFSEPIATVGSFLADNSCDKLSYQKKEPTLSEVLYYSVQNSLCGSLAVSFCIKLGRAGVAATYIKSPAMNLSVICPEEAFKGLSLRINAGASQAYRSKVDLEISAGPVVTAMALTNSPNCQEAAVWEALAPTRKAWPLAQESGTGSVYARFRDQVGHVSQCISASIALASASSPGLLTINNGAVATNAGSVSLRIAPIAGMTEMYVTNTTGCIADGVWELYRAEKTWSLPKQNAVNTVYVKLRDDFGGQGSCESASILHDNTAPGGVAVVINNAASRTQTSTVNLTLTAEGASEAYVTNTAGCTGGGQWEAFATTKAAWSLAQTNATASVYAMFRDALGNTSACVSDDIIHDDHAPTGLSLSIAAGALYTATNSVALSLGATGAAEMYITNTSGCAAGGSWESFSTSKSAWLLGQTDATATVYAKFKDEAGNESACTNDQILHDDDAPSAPGAFLDGSLTEVPNSTPEVSWTAASDSGSGLARYELALGSSPGLTDIVGWTTVGLVSPATLSAIGPLAPFETYYASLRAVDRAGNTSAAVQADGFTARYWHQEAYIKAANSNTADQFGVSAALAGDTLVVGARYEASNQTTITNGTGVSSDQSLGFAGAAYVYARTARAWAQQAYIKSANNNGHTFGEAVAIDEDTIAVGVPAERSNQTTITNGTSANTDTSSPARGATFVYRRTGTTWAQEAYIKAVNGGTLDFFGVSVGLDGDTLAVGAWSEDSNLVTVTNGATASANNSNLTSGAAYVYRRSASTWAQEAYIKAANNAADDAFGLRLTINGDTLAVQARDEDSADTTITNGTDASTDNSASKSGAVYVYVRSGTNWSQQAFIKPYANSANLNFGEGLGLNGDTLVVGAHLDSGNQTSITNGTTASTTTSLTQSGAAYVYVRSATTWSQQAYLKASNAGRFDRFGTRVAVDGERIAVAAADEDSGEATITYGDRSSSDDMAMDSGAVYLFRRTGTQWQQEAYLKAPNASTEASFGSSLSLSGDSVAVGAFLEASGATTITNGTTASSDDSENSAGAAYIFAR